MGGACRFFDKNLLFMDGESEIGFMQIWSTTSDLYKKSIVLLLFLLVIVVLRKILSGLFEKLCNFEVIFQICIK